MLCSRGSTTATTCPANLGLRPVWGVGRLLGQLPQQQLHRCSRWQSPVASLPASGEEYIPISRRKRSDWQLGPTFGVSKEDAVLMQLKALQENNRPFVDHGIEVVYRFAAFDPFARTNYFGRPFDLGQFERFRRIMHTPHFAPLLAHVEHQCLSELQVDELRWKQRVWVRGYKTNVEGVFEFTMIQRLGGRYDGIWFCDSLVCDDCDERSLIV